MTRTRKELERDCKEAEMYNAHDKFINNLFVNYPKLFQDERYLYMLSSPIGWFDLVDKLCWKINNLLEEAERKNGETTSCNVAQIKEKFGGLRFYIDLECSYEYRKLINKAIYLAEIQSMDTCQMCSKFGKRKNIGGYITTICDSCEKEMKEEAKEEGYSFDEEEDL